MDISHKYPYTNFEQLNIDFLLESVADHSNKITQLRTDLTAETAARTAEDAAIRADLQTEINTRIADVEVLTAEDEALTAFANAIQADLNTEIADRTAAVAAEAAARTAADDAMSDLFRADINELIGDVNTINTSITNINNELDGLTVLFHLSYGQGGVLDCLPNEANDIMKAFDENRRAMVQFPSGHWYERINVFNTTGAQFAYFALINYPSVITAVSGNIIELKHLDHDDTHTFNSRSFSVDTAPNIIHASTTDSVPTATSTITTTDDLWDVQFMDKLTYIELTTAGNKSPMVYVRDGYYEVPEGVRSGDYDAYFGFSLWNDATKYVLTVHLEKGDATDTSTWNASITALRIQFNPS